MNSGHCSRRWGRTTPMPLSDIKARIRAAAEDAGRDPGDVTLIAVSKKQPPERIEAAIQHHLAIYTECRDEFEELLRVLGSAEDGATG